MSKKCILVNPSVAASDLRPPLDWSKCVLCQRQTKEKLLCPDQAVGPNKDAGYKSVAEILPEFEKLGRLPPHLVLARIDEGNGLFDALKANSARWHKSCRNLFSTRELSHKTAELQKRSATEDVAAGDDTETDDFSAAVKRRCTRSEFVADNPLRAEIPVYFFCDLPAGQQALHAVSTFDVNARVKECASVLCDNRLLAKLAIGDMIALEAKYHVSCLTQLYNRRRAYERENFRELSSTVSSSGCLHHIAFAELTAYINDVRSVPDIVPVLKLVDLKKLYADRLQQLDVTVAQTINSTRLKEKLLAYFPDMRAQNDGRDIVLAFEDSLGAAVSKACYSDLDQDALHLARAAEIVRRDMFAGTWHFDSALHKGCQVNSVPTML